MPAWTKYDQIRPICDQNLWPKSLTKAAVFRLEMTPPPFGVYLKIHQFLGVEASLTPIYLDHQNFPIFSKKNCLSKDIISYKGMPTIIAGLLYLTPKEDDWKWVEIVFFVDSVYLIYSACFMTQPCLTHIWTIWDLIGTKDQMARITLYQLFWASSPLHPSSL